MATRSWNRVELIGNITKDPELKYTPQGTAVCTFSIATNRTYMSDGERKEEADFHRVVAWSKLAELCSQLLKKGNRVFVSGRLQNRQWEGQDGQTKYMTEIVIEDMLLLTSRGGEEYSASSSSDRDYSGPSKGTTAATEDITPEPVEEAELPKKDKEEEKPTPKEDPGDLDDLPF